MVDEAPSRVSVDHTVKRRKVYLKEEVVREVELD
jgi:hypothetical protein